MGAKERKIINKVLIDGSKKCRLFRANSGMGWAGKVIEKLKDIIILLHPRPFHGMPEGTADVIGWESKTLCEIICENSPSGCCSKLTCDECEYKKYKIAIFKAVEIKTGKQQLSKQQKRWRDKLIEDGGIYEERKDNEK